MELTTLQSIAVLIGALVVVGGLLGIYFFLKIHAVWVGLIFLTYWSGVQEFAIDKLFSLVFGGVTGLLLVQSLTTFNSLIGELGIYAFLTILVVVIYLLIIKKGEKLLNNFSVIILTVGLIPSVQEDFNLFDSLLSFLIAVTYFGGPVLIAHYFKDRIEAKNKAVSD